MQFEQITVGNTVKTLTEEKYAGYQYATIECRDANIMYRVDGGEPTTTLGHSLASGDVLKIRNAQEIAGFKAVSSGEPGATLAVTYSNYP